MMRRDKISRTLNLDSTDWLFRGFRTVPNAGAGLFLLILFVFQEPGQAKRDPLSRKGYEIYKDKKRCISFFIFMMKKLLSSN